MRQKEHNNPIWDKKKGRLRDKRGMTMAELLVVVAIIGILAGVVFINVVNYQRSLGQLERDEIAKEIFVAAQNHLTMAKGEDYLGKGKADTLFFGTKDGDDGAYYFIVNQGNVFSQDTALTYMLPFASIDETVRLGGNYIIRYDPELGIMLDVFYCSANSSPQVFNHAFSSDDYSHVMALTGSGNKPSRRTYAKGGNSILGWYGGSEALVQETPLVLKAPEIEVHNEEQLYVSIKDTNSDQDEASIRLLVTGETSGVSHYINIQKALGPSDHMYYVVLDDITTLEGHFFERRFDDMTTGQEYNGFIPGENIKIQAVAYSTTAVANIAYSAELTTNSLFASVRGNTARIKNIRHLENLDTNISKLSYTDLSTKNEKIKIEEAIQEENLSWKDFQSNNNQINDTIKSVSNSPEKFSVYECKNANLTKEGTYHPVSTEEKITYNGQDLSISDIAVDYAGFAGLFGATKSGSEIKNLELIDFSIKSQTKEAGALAGSLLETKVVNVAAYNTKKDIVENIVGYGSAGGLVGMAKGTTAEKTSISKCAASLYVKSSMGNAGGLVGISDTVTISASYAGGHTLEGKYIGFDAKDEEKAKAPVNVQGAVSVGGLIGMATDTSITKSYSTCSAGSQTAGANIGGFIGKAEGSVTVDETEDTQKRYSYAAGLVTGESESKGTFLGSGALSSSSHGYYAAGISMGVSGGSDQVSMMNLTTIPPMPKETNRTTAKSYDETLAEEEFVYPTIYQLGGGAGKFLIKHYGDWQPPRMIETNLVLENKDILRAIIELPKDQLGDEQYVSVLVHGDTTNDVDKDAYLVFKITKEAEEYKVELDEKSSIPGVGSSGIKEWFENAGGSAKLEKEKDEEVKDEEGEDEEGETKEDVLSFRFDLDNITQAGGHFTELFNGLIPGENITVVADGGEVSKDVLLKIATGKTDEWKVETSKSTDAKKDYRTIADRTNSLFGDIETADGKTVTDDLTADAVFTTADILYLRHLENLDASISYLGKNGLESKLNIVKAIQKENLIWVDSDDKTDDFISYIKENTSVSEDAEIKIYKAGETTSSAEANTFLPVNPSHYGESTHTPIALEYEGQSDTGTGGAKENHSITAVTIHTKDSAGLFGSLIEGSKVSNLELIDFVVTSSEKHAGALAGTLTRTDVTNVLVRENPDASGSSVIKASGTEAGKVGNAGGLVGLMTGGSVKESAASVYVRSAGGDAGGLIGSLVGGTSGSTVSESFSGGHTLKGLYTDSLEDPSEPSEGSDTDPVVPVNVIGAVNVGGLVGSASGTVTVKYSYSTCSAGSQNAKAGIVGGFMGASGNEASVKTTHSYAAGLVTGGLTQGAFIGNVNLDKESAYCFYIDGISGLPGSGIEPEGEVDLKTILKPKSMLKEANQKAPTIVYDATLSGKTFVYERIEDLKGTELTDTLSFAKHHVGDWQEPKLTEAELKWINEDILSAEISLPEFTEGITEQDVSLLIKGELSGAEAHLALKVTLKDGQYYVAVSEQSTIPKTAEANLSKDELNAWFEMVYGKSEEKPLSAVSGKVTFSLDVDNITKAGGHFTELLSTFIPGENIIGAVEGGAISQQSLEDKISEWETENEPDTEKAVGKTNSLLGEVLQEEKAIITSFRHLENLDASISHLGKNDTESKLVISKADQTVDLIWLDTANDTDDFVSVVAKKNGSDKQEIQVYRAGSQEAASGVNQYVPVTPSTYKGNEENLAFALAYKGANVSGEDEKHSLTGVAVDTDIPAGLFGSFLGGSISNLELIDFSVTTSKGHAGALAGTTSGTSISNILVHESAEATGSSVIQAVGIDDDQGHAGGLVGFMTEGSVLESAASVYVRSAGGDAGGLIGSLAGGTAGATVSESFSGGHTLEGAYTENLGEPGKTGQTPVVPVNVIAASNAGGLVGSLSGTVTVENSYSTCSAASKTDTGSTGGLLGAGEAGSTVTVKNSYAAGLVTGEGTIQGALVGNVTLVEGSDKCYFVEGLFALVGSGIDNKVLVTALTLPEDGTTLTQKYDSTLGDAFIYPTVADLSGKSIAAENAVYGHVGDWQKPVIVDATLIFNNEDVLSMDIQLPLPTAAEGESAKQVVSVLLQGEVSGQEAYLVFESTSAGVATLTDKSKIPGVETNELTAWFGNTKGTATKTDEDTKVKIHLELDNITRASGHFAELFTTFIPGENLFGAVEGGIFTQQSLGGKITEWKSKTAEEQAKDESKGKTNSLFGDSSDTTKAVVASFRHLENLDASISHLDKNDTENKLAIASAEQTEDLIWDEFLTETAKANGVEKTSIGIYHVAETQLDSVNRFLPVNPSHYGEESSQAIALSYTGQSTEESGKVNHSITGVVVNTADSAGLFGTLIQDSSVSNVELIDFSITSTGGNAGALVGTMTGTSVTNVLVHTSSAGDSYKITTSSASGNAGGLIGSMTDGSTTNSSVTESAAAVYVSSTGTSGNAGGFIGSSSGGTITKSYSGGHTTNGAYSDSSFDVTGAEKAGGLVGASSGTTITNSYSTCSATGKTVGGFVGETTGDCTGCYATGLVKENGDGAAGGAFAGSMSGTATNCQYFEIINERSSENGFTYLGAVGAADKDGITALDATVATYDSFVGAPSVWAKASPYDSKLGAYYKNGSETAFNLKTVDQLADTDKSLPSSSETPEAYVLTHYGDWPAPEIFVINQAS